MYFLDFKFAARYLIYFMKENLMIKDDFALLKHA